MTLDQILNHVYNARDALMRGDDTVALVYLLAVTEAATHADQSS